MKDKIFKIAKNVRDWAECHPLLNDVDLTGWCGICSFRIFNSLKKIKLNPIFVCVCDPWSESECHCFVFCGEYLIDVTATQFDSKKPINILNKDDAKYKKWYWNWENVCLMTSEVKFIKNFFVNWPREQNPFLFKEVLK